MIGAVFVTEQEIPLGAVVGRGIIGISSTPTVANLRYEGKRMRDFRQCPGRTCQKADQEGAHCGAMSAVLGFGFGVSNELCVQCVGGGLPDVSNPIFRNVVRGRLGVAVRNKSLTAKQALGMLRTADWDLQTLDGRGDES